MKEKIEKISFKYKVTIFTFFLFLIIGALSPLSGEDWKSYVIGKSGIIECFKNINISDGRIISGFLINFFSYNKILFDICFALLISNFIKMCNDLIGTVKSKYFYLYPLIGILIVSSFMFSYNYVSVTTTITYTFPTILFFMYFYLLLQDEELKTKTLIKLFLIAIYISLSSIHMALSFFIANLVYFVVNIKKQKSVKYFSLVITELVAIIISISKIDNGIISVSLNDSLGNIPYLIENVFSNNILIIIVGAIPINYYLNEKLKNNLYGRVVITLFDLILMFSLCYNFFSYSPVNLNLILSKYNGIFATENWYYIFYYITYLVLFFLSINHYIKNKKLKSTLNIYYLSSIILILFLLVSPIFDKGNIIFIMFTIVMISCVLAKEMDTRMYPRIIKAVVSLLIIYYVSMFGIIKYIDYTRGNYIKEQLSVNEKNIEVKANPLYLVWRYNPDYFQERDFKMFYDIPEEDTLEVKYFGIFKKIETKVKE